MLQFPLGPGGKQCDGLSRRDALSLGALPLLGLMLPELLQARAAAEAPRPRRSARSFGKAKSCILLFHMGGPSQHETFDPKPDAPAEIRGEFGTIGTSIPGYRVCELLPLTAKQLHRCTVIRSLTHDDSQHNNAGYRMLTGYRPPLLPDSILASPRPDDYPPYGAVAAKLKGNARGVPPWISLPYLMVNGPAYPGQGAGFLGGACEPFWIKGNPNLPGFGVDGLSLPSGVTERRLAARRSILATLEAVRRDLDAPRSFQELGVFQQRALDLATRPATRDACRLEREAPALRERYGRNIFGQSALLARRLIEAGAGLVSVYTIGSAEEDLPNRQVHWDTHANNFKDMKNVIMPIQDPAYAALLEDLDGRGLLDETLVIWMGEFGRTPKINIVAGRDHWPWVFPVVLAGGGIRRGLVYGESDDHGAYPRADPVSPEDLAATIYHCLGIAPETMLADLQGRQAPLCAGTPVWDLLDAA